MAFEGVKAEAEYTRASALDPASAEVHYRLGNMYLLSGRAAEAIAAFEQSKHRDPLYELVDSYLGRAYSLAGRHREAAAEAERGLELEPEGLPQMGMLAVILNRAGRFDVAVGRGAADRASPRGAASRHLGPRCRASYAYLGLSDTTKGLAEFERTASTDGDLVLAHLPMLLPSFGQPVRHGAATIQSRRCSDEVGRPGTSAMTEAPHFGAGESRGCVPGSEGRRGEEALDAIELVMEVLANAAGGDLVDRAFCAELS